MATKQENHDAMQVAIAAKNTRKACMYANALVKQLEALGEGDPLGVTLEPIELEQMPGSEARSLYVFKKRIERIAAEHA